jgi:hypothetical protein
MKTALSPHVVPAMSQDPTGVVDARYNNCCLWL